MYKTLSSLLEKPELYAKTSAKFWNDPHISASMLALHLNPETDAASRKPDAIDRSVRFIGSLLPEGASLLDIGCGPGLYTRRLAQRGLRVTGLDFSASSIAWAKQNDAGSDYILQDYLRMDFDEQFDMVTLIWCDYGALVPEDRQNLLRRIYRALKPGGLFLFDVYTPMRYDSLRESTAWELCGNGGFWSPNPHLCLSAQYLYRGHIGLSRYVIVEDAGTRDYNIWDTSFTRETLSEELEGQGFLPPVFYADAEGSALDAASITLCALLRKGRGEH
ncbi:MAG: class I SAM-dependent methyltransferase [Christensenellales bacterium]